MFDGIRAIVLDTNFAVHGVPATVTPPASAPITTRLVWLTTDTAGQPIGADFAREDPRRVACLKRAEVASVPLETMINAPERPGVLATNWRVDGYLGLRADQHRVIVVPV